MKTASMSFAHEETGEDTLSGVLRAKHLPALDGIRAISVMVVMLFHYLELTAAGYFFPADLGVGMFFVLSGFLITRILLGEFEKTGDISLSRFAKRRVFRIFPAYYVFVLGVFALDHLRGISWIRGLLPAALLYGVNYFTAFTHPPATQVSHTWSLAVEEQFYLLWPLVFLLLARGGRRRLVNGVMGLILLVVAWRSFAYLALGFDATWVYHAFDTRFDNLLVGCLLAIAVESRRVRVVGSMLGKNALFPLLTIGLLVLSRYHFGDSYRHSVGFTVNAVLMAVILLQLIALNKSAWWGWLDSGVMKYIGLISYPIYLYHELAEGVVRHLPFDASMPITVFESVLMSFALASMSYWFIEKPFLKLRDRVT